MPFLKRNLKFSLQNLSCVSNMQNSVYILMLGNCTKLFLLPLLKFIGETRKYEQSIYATIKCETEGGIGVTTSQSTKRNTILEHPVYEFTVCNLESQNFCACVLFTFRSRRGRLWLKRPSTKTSVLCAHMCSRACAKSDSPVDKANRMGPNERNRLCSFKLFPSKIPTATNICFLLALYNNIMFFQIRVILNKKDREQIARLQQ